MIFYIRPIVEICKENCHSNCIENAVDAVSMVQVSRDNKTQIHDELSNLDFREAPLPGGRTPWSQDRQTVISVENNVNKGIEAQKNTNGRPRGVSVSIVA